MKKPGIRILLLITGVAVSFILGFFVGRNVDRNPMRLESLSPTLTTTVPEAAIPSQIEFPINLNTATKEELMALPGVGEVLAGRILRYREENGYFRTLEELTNVSGIGQARLDELKDYITLGGYAQ